MASTRNYGLKITVKLTMRAPLKASCDLTQSLDNVYQERQLALSRINREKRYSTKLKELDNGLYLVRGSWWPSGPNESLLTYDNIIQYQPCGTRPAKVLLLVTTQDKTQTELVVVKTKGVNYSNQLLSVLQSRVRKAHDMLREEQRVTHPVNYQVEEISTQRPETLSINTVSESPQVKEAPIDNIETTTASVAPAPVVLNSPVRSRQSTGSNSIKTGSKPGSLVEFIPLTKMETPIINRPSSSGHLSNSNSNIRAQDQASNHSEHSSKHINSGEKPEVTYYGANNMPKLEKPLYSPTRKPKRRIPRELTNLNSAANQTTEFDESNIPWEVNISYIKYDPMVGSVESESGPIYMYTAHQLVARTPTDYNTCESVHSSESDEDVDASYSGESQSDDVESSDDDELERFMMLSRLNNSRSNQIQRYKNKV